MTTSQLELRRLPSLIISFCRSPLEVVKRPVRFGWVAAIALQITTAALFGALAGLINQNRFDVLCGVFEFPIIDMMIVAITTLFIYYYFANFAATFLDIRRLYALTILANLPHFAIHAFSSYLPPLDLIGFACTVVLLTVGLVEQFSLDKRIVISLAALMYSAFFAIWSFVQLALG